MRVDELLIEVPDLFPEDGHLAHVVPVAVLLAVLAHEPQERGRVLMRGGRLRHGSPGGHARHLI